MNFAATRWVMFRVEVKQDLHGFAPVGVIAFSIQEPQIEGHMLTIIGRERLALRRFLQKCRCQCPISDDLIRSSPFLLTNRRH
ncbi:MAG: hypothetical protein IPM67_05380 [Sphingomonadales bacterium]|nr:hypothetical protein [Sphingomonadales bacterium]